MSNDKLKVALCFSGQLRSVQETYENYIRPNLIDCNIENCIIDVFFHTWFAKEDMGNSYQIAGNKAEGQKTPDDVLKQVYQFYNPKKFLSEEQIEFDEKDYNNNKARLIIPKFTLSKNYSLKQVAKLTKQYEKEKNFKYDIVHQLRPDLGMQRQVHYSAFDCSHKKIIVSTHAPGHAVDVSNAIMDSDTFQEYSQFFDHIDRCYRQGARFSDERLMFHYLMTSGFSIDRRQNLSNYILVR